MNLLDSIPRSYVQADIMNECLRDFDGHYDHYRHVGASWVSNHMDSRASFAFSKVLNDSQLAQKRESVPIPVCS